MIAIRGLTVRLGGVAVVRDADLDVAPGECFGLVGESGSGKSTILRTIMGLNPDWSGTIEIDGLDIRRTPRADLYRRVQMVFQDPYASLHPRRMVGEAIEEPMRINKVPEAAARTLALLEMIGLGPDFRFRFPHELSGGQRQRVAIARALGLSPRVLLLDEPTSALDVSIQAEILNLLDDLRKRMGLTCLFVSHDLAVISHMCERFSVMRHAGMVETVTREALVMGRFSDPYTERLVALSDGAG